MNSKKEQREKAKNIWHFIFLSALFLYILFNNCLKHILWQRIENYINVWVYFLGLFLNFQEICLCLCHITCAWWYHASEHSEVAVICDLFEKICASAAECIGLLITSPVFL